MELLQGITDDKEHSRLKVILSSFKCYPMNHNSIMEAGNIYRECQKNGYIIKPIDCIIATNCIENNLELFHKDNHFNIISNVTKKLRIYEY